MSLTLQPKILRFLENGEYRKVGGTKIQHSDVRVVSSTNKNLVQAVKDGEFRRDLLYRLKVIRISVPPLRYRKDDIKELAKFFISNYENKYLSPNALDELRAYNWPGNVRELKNVLEQASIFSKDFCINVNDLKLNDSIYTSFDKDVEEQEESLKLEEVEEVLIRKALLKTGYNRVDASALLGISQKTLYTKTRKYNIL